MSDPNRPHDPGYGEQPPPGDPLVQPVTSGTQDPRLGLEVGRFWAGALATMLVAALIGLAADFILEEVLDLEIHSQADLLGTGSDLAAWAVVGALFALAAAALLYVFVVSTPRPRAFFGWVVSLATVVLAALPFADRAELVPAVLAAVVWIVIGSAVGSLLTGTLSRTVVRRSVT